MKEIHNNQEIPIPEGLEQRLSALVDRLEAEEKEQGMKNEKSKFLFISLAIAAAFVAVAFLLIAPQVRERQELALYEGSYTFINGQRIDDLGQIKADINEANAVFQDILGHTLEYTRPPYGNINDAVRNNVGTPMILWSVDTLDWKNQNTDIYAKNL